MAMGVALQISADWAIVNRVLSSCRRRCPHVLLDDVLFAVVGGRRCCSDVVHDGMGMDFRIKEDVSDDGDGEGDGAAPA